MYYVRQRATGVTFSVRLMRDQIRTECFARTSELPTENMACLSFDGTFNKSEHPVSYHQRRIYFLKLKFVGPGEIVCEDVEWLRIGGQAFMMELINSGHYMCMCITRF